jgi:Fe-S-cluster containining protein
MATAVLEAPIRHACTACGGSCQGVRVRLTDDDERARIAELGPQLGVDDPLEGDVLRMRGGACVFQREDGLCAIHRQFGAEAKPRICRQYPLVGLKDGRDVRVGIDPGCYAGLETRRSGPEVSPRDLAVSRNDVSEREAMFEEAFLDLSGSDDASVARMIAWLTGQARAANTLPPGFAGRLVQRVQAASLDVLLDLPDTSPKLRHHLLTAADWDPAAPPAWPALTPEVDAYAVDVARRMVFLRLGVPALPSQATAALLTLCGAVLLGWAAPRPEHFGPALAAWARAIRARTFWRALAPDGRTLSWLATGEDAAR